VAANEKTKELITLHHVVSLFLAGPSLSLELH